MTAFFFHELPLDTRCNLLWTKGCFLFNFTDEAQKHLCNLYDFAGLLVELKYQLGTKEVICVQAVDPADHHTLLLYLSKAPLPDYPAAN